jgi:hypothetical protein
MQTERLERSFHTSPQRKQAFGSIHEMTMLRLREGAAFLV